MYMSKPNDRSVEESICILLKKFSKYKTVTFLLKFIFCLVNTTVFPIDVKSYICIVNIHLIYFNFLLMLQQKAADSAK